MKLALEMVNGEIQELTVEDDTLKAFLERVDGTDWMELSNGAINVNNISRVRKIEEE